MTDNDYIYTGPGSTLRPGQRLESASQRITNKKPSRKSSTTKRTKKPTQNNVRQQKENVNVTIETPTDSTPSTQDLYRSLYISSGPDQYAPYGYKFVTYRDQVHPHKIPITEEEYKNGMQDGIVIDEWTDPSENTLNWMMAGAMPAARAGITALGKAIPEMLGFETLYPYVSKASSVIGSTLGSGAARLAALLGLSTAANTANAQQYSKNVAQNFPNITNGDDYARYVRSIVDASDLQNLNINQLKQLANLDPTYKFDNAWEAYTPVEEGFVDQYVLNPYNTDLLFLAPAVGYNMASPVRDYRRIDPEAKTEVYKQGQIDLKKLPGDVKGKKIGKNMLYEASKVPQQALVLENNVAPKSTSISTRQFKHPKIHAISSHNPMWWLTIGDLLYHLGAYGFGAYKSTADKLKAEQEEHALDVARWARNAVEAYYSNLTRQQLNGNTDSGITVSKSDVNSSDSVMPESDWLNYDYDNDTTTNDSLR